MNFLLGLAIGFLAGMNKARLVAWIKELIEKARD